MLFSQGCSKDTPEFQNKIDGAIKNYLTQVLGENYLLRFIVSVIDSSDLYAMMAEKQQQEGSDHNLYVKQSKLLETLPNDMLIVLDTNGQTAKFTIVNDKLKEAFELRQK